MAAIPDDVVQYLTMQMTKLHQNNTQVALKVAACLGSQFGERGSHAVSLRKRCCIKLFVLPDLLTFKKAKVTGVPLEAFLPTLTSSGFLHEVYPGKFMW